MSACLALGKDPAEDTVMAKPDAGFGQAVGKLQRTILGKQKDLRYEILFVRGSRRGGLLLLAARRMLTT